MNEAKPFCISKKEVWEAYKRVQANKGAASRLALSRQLLASSSATEKRAGTHDVRSEDACLWHCPRCGASMIVIQRFTPEELSACTYFDSS